MFKGTNPYQAQPGNISLYINTCLLDDFETDCCCCYNTQTGLSCSKLTTSLVNVSLKFQMLVSQICQYFLLKKFEKLLQCKSFSHFSTKNITVFLYKVEKHLTS